MGKGSLLHQEEEVRKADKIVGIKKGASPVNVMNAVLLSLNQGEKKRVNDSNDKTPTTMLDRAAEKNFCPF